MRFAIQEDMLPGKTPLEQFECARRLGFQGVEVWGCGLTGRVPALVEARRATGLAIAAVNHGRQSDLLHPDRAERERALAELRESIVNAVDLGAAGVIVVPHFGEPSLPDLTPYKSVIQLEYELLHNHLRTLSDYVYAMGTDLYIEPINRYETHFINTLADGARVRRKIKDNPHIKLVADLFHMALEETDVPGALRDYAADVAYLHLADSNRRLPGRGLLDFVAIGAALREFSGWVSLEIGEPGNNQANARQIVEELPACLDFLKRAGWFAPAI
ncbi:MAG: sugar phosphate isomerase/epimerase [Chloroflexi bacterium]|nr:sugar phosphate isomerase/epimerase [Chloroflexota bacterium]